MGVLIVKWRSVLLTITVLGVTAAGAGAGATMDYGTVPGTPSIGQVNWTAWLGSSNPPTQVLTEDSTNPGSGTDQGYQDFGLAPNPKWLLQVAQFNNPVASYGNTVSIILGGLGASSGSGWQDSFVWASSPSESDQGQATALGSFSACPTMVAGFQDDSGKTVNWSPSGKYHIYRSQNSSGAENGHSSGRYDYVSTVTGTTYKDTVCQTGTNCWHVVIPADPTTNAIIGCHSEESNPNAVTLSSFRAADPAPNWPLIAGLVFLAATTVGGALILARRRVHSR